MGRLAGRATRSLRAIQRPAGATMSDELRVRRADRWMKAAAIKRKPEGEGPDAERWWLAEFAEGSVRRTVEVHADDVIRAIQRRRAADRS